MSGQMFLPNKKWGEVPVCHSSLHSFVYSSSLWKRKLAQWWMGLFFGQTWSGMVHRYDILLCIHLFIYQLLEKEFGRLVSGFMYFPNHKWVPQAEAVCHSFLYPFVHLSLWKRKLARGWMGWFMPWDNTVLTDGIRHGVLCRYANLHSIHLAFDHQFCEKGNMKIVRNLSLHSLLVYSDAFQNPAGKCCEEEVYDCIKDEWQWAGPKFQSC